MATIVINKASELFAANDRIVEFSKMAKAVVTYSGAFTNFNLPSLSPGLAWNTSALNVSGTLPVTSDSPAITSLTVFNGHSLIVSGTGGPANQLYYILMTTNLASPQWVTNATGLFDASGNFGFTNIINQSWPQVYYRIEVP